MDELRHTDQTLARRRVATRSLAALLVALQLAVGIPGATLAAETTTLVPVGVFPCEGEIPLCNPAQHVGVTTDGTLRAQVDASEANCVAITIDLRVDGVVAFTSEPVAPGASTGVADLGPVSPGTHMLSVEARVPLSIACDSRGWSGTLSVTTSGIAAQDAAVVPPGGTVTVSTALVGSPRSAGVTATLYRSASAGGSATVAVATYDGLPSAQPSGPPIRAAGYLDLALANPHPGDVIAAEFYPVDPIYPTDPILPPSPFAPGGPPILPPNPIRLAYWTGSSWDAVFGSGGALPTYSSASNAFNVTFDISSTPSVTALGGTVFAAVPSYYFRGFGTPLDPETLNVAKAGRAIPLKWQVFDFAVNPVTELDPAVVSLSSVAIPCDGTGQPSDGVEEYATGSSGLQNHGDGGYQLNWASSKSYAGTCRRLRLDLGERNPDGTPFYRTADFRFTR